MLSQYKHGRILVTAPLFRADGYQGMLVRKVLVLWVCRGVSVLCAETKSQSNSSLNTLSCNTCILPKAQSDKHKLN